MERWRIWRAAWQHTISYRLSNPGASPSPALSARSTRESAASRKLRIEVNDTVRFVSFCQGSLQLCQRAICCKAGRWGGRCSKAQKAYANGINRWISSARQSAKDKDLSVSSVALRQQCLLCVLHCGAAVVHANGCQSGELCGPWCCTGCGCGRVWGGGQGWDGEM